MEKVFQLKILLFLELRGFYRIKKLNKEILLLKTKIEEKKIMIA